MLCKQFDLPFACFVQFPEEHDPFFFHLKKIREKMTHITRQIEITPNRCKRENELSIHYLCWIIRKNFFYLSEETSSRNLKSKENRVFPQHHPGAFFSVQQIWQTKCKEVWHALRDTRGGSGESGFLCFRSLPFTIYYTFDIADLRSMRDRR